MEDDIGTYAWYERLWFTESNWQRSRKGNYYYAGPKGLSGGVCTVFPYKQGWNYALDPLTPADNVFGPGDYRTRREATEAAFHQAMRSAGIEADFCQAC